jgi:hypothetical protein
LKTKESAHDEVTDDLLAWKMLEQIRCNAEERLDDGELGPHVFEVGASRGPASPAEHIDDVG